MSISIQRVFAFLSLALIANPVLAEDRSIIVLDASGSMWGQIDGRPKLEIAREALGQVLQGIPAESELGLMAYGHREKGSCEDIELIVPPSTESAAAISEAANRMKFLGKTPLSEAVRRAAIELRATEEKATVILITDGIETCNADPCALGNELEASGVDFTAHVVGFGLTEDEGKQVACLAENTGGKYIEAKDATALVEALKTTVAAAPTAEPSPEPVVEPEPAPELLENVDPVLRLVAGGEEPEIVSDAYFDLTPVDAAGAPTGDVYTIYGKSLGTLPAGDYSLTAKLGKAQATVPVTVAAEGMTTIEVVLDAGILDVAVLAEQGGDVDPEGYWEVRGPEDVTVYGYAKGRVVLPAGEYALKARLGTAEVNEAVVIEPGGISEKRMVMGIGVAKLTSWYTPDLRVESGDPYYEIFAAQTAVDGTRTSVVYNYGSEAVFDLVPGDYIALSKLGEASVEMPFTVKAAEQTELKLVLNAGVAAIDLVEGAYLEVRSAKTDINGERKLIAYSYGPLQVTLPAGDYIATADREGAKAEQNFTVSAGERVELALTLP
ncbi:vWA domain-containing protein [Thioclava sp. FR2]|uniref:vWA domain-containing protein n=1 Tax=Thioclava sp. FR2 TaxID=3445780 RepID=UPI003EC0C595